MDSRQAKDPADIAAALSEAGDGGLIMVGIKEVLSKYKMFTILKSPTMHMWLLVGVKHDHKNRASAGSTIFAAMEPHVVLCEHDWDKACVEFVEDANAILMSPCKIDEDRLDDGSKAMIDAIKYFTQNDHVIALWQTPEKKYRLRVGHLDASIDAEYECGSLFGLFVCTLGFCAKHNSNEVYA